MEEVGLVVETNGGMARVRLVRRATCDKCGICGIGRAPEIVVEVPNTINARPGDAVRLVMEGGNLLRAAAAAYLIPLFCLLGGYLLARAALARIGATSSLAEFLAVVTGFLCLGLSYLWLRAYDRRRGDRLTPRMVAVVEPPEPLP
ncbi:MAG: SoxR reducing system RseC family protein [Bacillota bacterium]